VELSEVQRGVERAADAIAELPPGRWAQWVAYLLEALQSKTAAKDFYSEVLADVAGAIDERLEAGRW